MTEKVREVAQSREVAQGEARRCAEPAMEGLEAERPREWVPVDSPQVPAGEGRPDMQTVVNDSGVGVGAQKASRGKASEKESRTNHPGGGRWLEEELEAVRWLGGWASPRTPSRSEAGTRRTTCMDVLGFKV